jgi:hypothetical protein
VTSAQTIADEERPSGSIQSPQRLRVQRLHAAVNGIPVASAGGASSSMLATGRMDAGVLLRATADSGRRGSVERRAPSSVAHCGKPARQVPQLRDPSA